MVLPLLLTKMKTQGQIFLYQEHLRKEGVLVVASGQQETVILRDGSTQQMLCSCLLFLPGEHPGCTAGRGGQGGSCWL
jgi:hypothetical protein